MHRNTCDKCGRRLLDYMTPPIRCVCGNIIGEYVVFVTKEPDQPPAQPTKDGPKAWLAIHSYPVQNATSWNENDAKEWYRKWLTTIPSYGCSCSSNWKKYTRHTPPPLLTAQGFFEWSVVAHNHVSTHHAEPRKEAITLQQAAIMYNAPWRYE
jgi:hypothetical protein